MLRKILFPISLAVATAIAGDCPDITKVQGKLRKLTDEMKVVAVSSSDVNGLCETVVEIGQTGKKGVIYVSKDAKHLFIGELISLDPVVSLVTKNRVLLLNSKILPKSTINLLKSYTDIVYNPGQDKFIYFITDPDCPYCKEAEKFLDTWAKERGVEIRAILYPLTNVHPEAMKKSVTMVCEGKGWEELKQGYMGKNECKEGKEKIEQNIGLAQRLGFRGTPVFIGMNGIVVEGLPQDGYIFEKLIDMKLAGE